MSLRDEEYPLLEEAVNTTEYTEAQDWPEIFDDIVARAVEKLGHPLEEAFLETLNRDLRDWWKNGNLVADPDFPWTFGEYDFWGEPIP